MPGQHCSAHRWCHTADLTPQQQLSRRRGRAAGGCSGGRGRRAAGGFRHPSNADCATSCTRGQEVGADGAGWGSVAGAEVALFAAREGRSAAQRARVAAHAPFVCWSPVVIAVAAASSAVANLLRGLRNCLQLLREACAKVRPASDHCTPHLSCSLSSMY